jgi:tRNA nucleotidyltransferase (CCA-adding enzyme)
MNVILGHSNLDLDCIGSMVLAKYLYPDHQPVGSRFIHPVAKNLYNLYSYHLNFIPSHELANNTVEHILVVDTRSQKRVQEYFERIGDFHGGIDVYDHHPSDGSDISGAVIHENEYGANTTYFALELQKQNIRINADDATIALAGIYADTGNFTHDNVARGDFTAADYLMENIASVSMVRKLLGSLKEDHQVTLFHQLLNDILYQDFHGNLVALGFVELDGQIPGLAAVVEKIFEVENVDAIFAAFSFKKENDVLIIARSQKGGIEVNRLMKKFGGAGHSQASSALIKGRSGGDVFRELLRHIDNELTPAITAENIMSKDVHTLNQDWSLLEASMYLEKLDYTGAPVVDGAGKMVGFMSLRNIMLGRKGGNMNAPVRAYMIKKVITAARDTTIRHIENLFFKNNIGHLLIMENDTIIGLVTRSDYLNYIDAKRIRNK